MEKNEEKIMEEKITITNKYIYDKSNSYAYKKERIIDVDGIIIYNDIIPIDNSVPKFDTIIDKFEEWCRKASISIIQWQ